MEEYNVLTKDEIIDRLKSMEVGVGKELPWKILSFIIFNPDYDPESFSQEIEDSEEAIDYLDEIMKEMNKPEFDFVWNNTLSSVKKNSEKWFLNHSKICKVILDPYAMVLQCAAEHKDGTRNYYSEFNVNRLMEYSEKKGGILNFA